MSHILVGLHQYAHRGQEIPALIGHGHHRAAVPVALDYLPIGGSHNNGAGNAVALCHMTEILHNHATDNFKKLLTIIGNDLPVLDRKRSHLTNVNMNWNHLQVRSRRQDGCGRRHDRQAYAFPHYPP